MKISIVLLIKNGAKFLPELLSILNRQKGDFEKELIVIDSGSTDGSSEYPESIKVLKYLSIKVYKIKPEDFGHGKTRNFAVSKCSGEIVVFLSQDALPASLDWLSNLVGPLSGFETKFSLVGVFGRQIPYDNTNLCEKYFYERSYPDQMRILTEKNSENFSNLNLFFSNVNGASRKELLLKYPFREDLLMSEDQYWGREVLRHGYEIVYEPKAVVFHSHNYNLKQLFKRYFQSGYSQRQIGLSGAVFKKGLGTATGLLEYIIKKKPWLLPYGIVYETVKGVGFLIGRKGILPGFLEKTLFAM